MFPGEECQRRVHVHPRSFWRFRLGANLFALFRDAHHVIEPFCFDGSVVKAFFERFVVSLGREFCIVNRHAEALLELHHQ